MLALFDGNPTAIMPLLERGEEVVVAHSKACARGAEAFVYYLRAQGFHASAANLGECVDPEETMDALRGLNFTAPYRLAYTDGTRISAACAIWKHLEDHGGAGHELRLYLDEWSGTIQDDSGGHREVAPTITLRDLLGSAGLTYRHDCGPIRPLTSDDQAILALEKLRAAVINNRPHTGVIARHFTDIPATNHVGMAGELLVAGAVALAARRAVGEDYEVLTGVAAYRDPRGGLLEEDKTIAEFDVVLRIRQTLIHCEVKRADYNARGLFIERDALGRFVFGRASHMWTVVLRETNEEFTEEMEELEELGRTAGTMQDRYRFDTLTSEFELRSFIDSVAQRLRDLAPRDVQPGVPTVHARPDALVCALGNPTVVQAAARELAPATVGFISPQQGPHVMSVPNVTAPTVHAVARAAAPRLVVITCGPKSALAGFVRYVYENPTAQLVHLSKFALPLRDGTWSRVVRRGNPVAGWDSTPRAYEDDFSALASSPAFAPAQLAGLQESLRGIASHGASRGCHVYIPAESNHGRLAPLGFRYEEHVNVDIAVLTGRHASAMVAVVSKHPKQRDSDLKAATWARKRIVEVEAQLEAVTSAVNRVLVCVPPTFDAAVSSGNVHRSSWESVAAGNDWLDLVFYTPDSPPDVPDEFWRQLV